MVRWADPERIERAVRAYGRDLRARNPLVTQVLWYGSWVTGVPTPASDVDLCVVLRSDHRRPRDRIPDFLPDRFPVGIDLKVITEEELQELAATSPSWHRAILAGRVV